MSKKQQKKNYSTAYNRGGKNYSERNQKPAKKNSKKKLITLGSIALALAVVLTLSLIFSVYEAPYLDEITNDAPDTVSSKGTIMNGSFTAINASLLSQYPFYPAAWTYTKRNVNETVGGIISTAADEKDRVKRNLEKLNVDSTLIDGTIYDASNKLTDAVASNGDDVNFDDDDNGNLMMLYNSAMSYQKIVSESFTMWGGEYKRVRVWVKTAGGGAVDITLRVGPSTTSFEEKFVGVSTGGKWAAYDFYLEANSAWSKTLYLEVALGTKDEPAKGMALVDQAEFESIPKADFIKMKYRSDGTVAETLAPNEKVKSYDEPVDSTNLFTFDSNNNKLQGITYKNTTNGYQAIEVKDWETEDNKYPFYQTEGEKSWIYSLNNPTVPITDSTTKSEQFTVAVSDIAPSTASDHYRISFWLKTDGLAIDKGAYLYLKSTPYINGSLSKIHETASTLPLIRTTTTEDVQSGWMNCVFYVRPSNTLRYSLELTVSLGKEEPKTSDTPTFGSLYATEFEMVTIEKTDYNSASTDARSAKVDLDIATVSGISNGDFNTPTSPATGNSNLGLSPEGWEMRYQPVKDNDGNIVKDANDKVTHYENFSFGIVPYTASVTGDYTKYLPTDGSVSTIFGKLPGRDNVFAVKGGKNNAADKFAFSIRSSGFTLGAHTNSLVSVLVYTNSTFLPYLSVSLGGDLVDDDGNPVLKFAGITTANMYRTPTDHSFGTLDIPEDQYPTGTYYKINFIVSTGELSKSSYLQIDFGSEGNLAPANAWFVVDEARNITLSDDEYDEILENAFKDVDKDIETEIILEEEYDNIKGKDYTKIDVPEEEEDDDDDEEEEEEDDTPREPFNWIYLSSIILSLAIIVFLVSIFIKKLKLFRKKEVYGTGEEYKRK